MKIGNSVQVVVKDSSGNAVDGASVVVKDKNGTTVWSGTTNSSGETERFNTFWRQTYISAGDGSASTHNIYLYNKDNDKDYDWGWATGYTHTYYPFTVEVSKSGYQTATWVDNFNKIDDMNGYTLLIPLLTIEEGTIVNNYLPFNLSVNDIKNECVLSNNNISVSVSNPKLIVRIEDDE